jgi:hypothetical protein
VHFGGGCLHGVKIIQRFLIWNSGKIRGKISRRGAEKLRVNPSMISDSSALRLVGLGIWTFKEFFANAR